MTQDGKMIFPVLLFFPVYMLQTGALVFVDEPAPFGEVIYIPPKGDLIVLCSTQNPADITWKSSKGVKYRPGNAKLNISQVTDRKSVLYVRSNSDAAKGILRFDGPFWCQAQDRATLQERATSPFKFRYGSEPSIMDQSLNSVSIPIGQSVKLFCAMSHSIVPSVSMTWTFQRGYIQLEQNSTNITLEFDKTLFNLEVAGQIESNGTYQCKISNQFGVALSKPIDVIVTYLGNMTISTDPPYRQVAENNDVKISAQVDSNPAPYNITLSKGGILKISVSNRMTLDYTFTARKGDTGSFMMRSVHVSGCVHKMFYLTVLRINFYFVNVTHHSVTYNCLIGIYGNTSVTGVKLCCGENSDDIKKSLCAVSVTSQEADEQFSSDTLFGLLPITTYSCEIYVISRVGVTASGFPKMITTKPTVPSKPNVTGCISEEETSIFLTWTLFNGGSEIKQYVVRYRSFGNVNVWKNQTLKDGIATQTRGSIQLSGLTKQTKYAVEIIAINNVGRSPAGGCQCFTTCNLSEPLEWDNRRTVLKNGLAIQLYVDSRCGDVVKFTSKLCSGKRLETTFSPIRDQIFWVNITGLEREQRCIMTKVTTDTEVSSSFATFEITRFRGSSRDAGGETSVLTIAFLTTVLPTCLIIILVVLVVLCQRRKRETQYTNNQKGETLTVNAEEIPMQESRAYGSLPLTGSGRISLKNSPLYAHAQTLTSN